MGIAAPVIVKEMADWVSLGGGNSGIVGNKLHDYGFHLAANEIPSSDYSRSRDPNGSDGPFVNWNYACAGDFDHKNKERLRTKHRALLAKLMRGELPRICEFISQPWTDRPVYYWARWNGVKTLQKYTGAGHDHWSHISWFRSRANHRAYLWLPNPIPPTPTGLVKGDTGEAVRKVQRFFLATFPSYKNSVTVRRGVPMVVDGAFGAQLEAWVKEFQKRVKLETSGKIGPKTFAEMAKFGYK